MNWGAMLSKKTGGTSAVVDEPPVDRTEAGEAMVQRGASDAPISTVVETEAPGEDGIDRTEVSEALGRGVDDPAEEIPREPGMNRESPRPVTRRRTKLTLARALWIVEMIRCGNGLTEVARRSGVSRSTFQSWLARGRAGESGFREFVAAIEQAGRDHARDAAGG